MAASKGRLGDLHNFITEYFHKKLENAKDQGYDLSAAEEAVIVKFLKDNEISADADSVELDSLRASLNITTLDSIREKKQQEILAKSKAIEGDDVVDLTGVL